MKKLFQNKKVIFILNLILALIILKTFNIIFDLYAVNKATISLLTKEDIKINCYNKLLMGYGFYTDAPHRLLDDANHAIHCDIPHPYVD